MVFSRAEQSLELAWLSHCRASERGGACTIENPWWPEHAFCVVDGSGASVPTRQSDADPSTVTFPTTAAVWYACRAC